MRTTGQSLMDLVQCFLRAVELEIVAGEKPKASEVGLPEDTGQRVRQWAEDEAERDRQREAFVGKLQAAAKNPMAVLEERGG